MKNHVWIIQRKIDGWGYRLYDVCSSRADARAVVKYYNGFAHNTKNATFRVRKYEEVGR